MLIRVRTLNIRTNPVPAEWILPGSYFIRLIIWNLFLENYSAVIANTMGNCKLSLHGVGLSYTIITLYGDISGISYRATKGVARVCPNQQGRTTRRMRCRFFVFVLIKSGRYTGRSGECGPAGPARLWKLFI